MNYSIYSADRMTHLKIVVVALVASIGVAGFGVLARVSAGDEYSQTERAIKAARPSVRAEGLPSRCLPGRSLCST
jgi:hypothetical protein